VGESNEFAAVAVAVVVVVVVVVVGGQSILSKWRNIVDGSGQTLRGAFCDDLCHVFGAPNSCSELSRMRCKRGPSCPLGWPKVADLGPQIRSGQAECDARTSALLNFPL